MKRLKKGPELKMPEVKVPTFLVDLFHDLRDRRLLPLIGLVLVAIVAVPFLLGDDPEEPIATSQGAAIIEELKREAADPASLTVVEAKPGLRDYRKRLRGRRPTDPFQQRFTAPALDGAELPESEGGGSAGGGDGSSGETTTTVKTEDGGGSVTVTETEEPAPGGESGSGAGKGQPPIQLYSFAIDVKIVRTTGEGADKQTAEPTVRHRVLPTTSLPGEKAQVVTYMGISPKTEQPTFLVSTEVTAMFGEGKCAAGSEVCQLVELEPGFPQTFVYGEAGDRYKLKVLNVAPVSNGAYGSSGP